MTAASSAATQTHVSGANVSVHEEDRRAWLVVIDPQAIFDYLYFHSIPSPRTIYRNVFRMAVDVDGQMGKLTGHARETMQREYDRLLRELNRLYTMNHAVKKYREAQHDRT